VNRPGAWFDAPRPWHLILSPALPILALLAGNFAGLVPGAAIWSLTLTIGLSVVVALIIGRLVRDLRRGALAVSILVLVFLSQSTFSSVGTLIHIPALQPLSFVLAILVAGYIVRAAGDLKAWTTFANALVVCSTLLVMWPTVVQQARRWQHPTNPLGQVDVPPRGDQGQPPDIYILILDGYGRADVLHDYFHFENSLVPDLQGLGFQIPARAASNYAQTAQSLASSLNLEYLPALLGPQGSPVAARARFADLIAHNRFFDTLASGGYRIRSYASEYQLLQPQGVHERPHPRLYLTDFEYGLYQGTALPMLLALAGLSPGTIPFALHRHHVLWTLDHLAGDLPGKDDPPTLVFAHLLIPHPPFAFEADGRPLRSQLPANFSDASHWRQQAQGSGEMYESGYTKAVEFLNSRVLDIVRRVVNRRDGRRTIFYIQGDHGPGSRLQWEAPNDTNMRERLAILLAVRFPDDGLTGLGMPPDITPVNAFRTVLNGALHIGLPSLENRSFFSRWSEPLTFIDVTNRMAR
jgi:hypothetical protein